MRDDFCLLNERAGLQRDWDNTRTAGHIAALPIWSPGIWALMWP